MPVILISQETPAGIRRRLERYGEVRLLPPYERLPAPVMSHCDMLMFLCCGRLFVWKEYHERHPEIFDDLPVAVVLVDSKPSYIYPGDVGLDLLTLDNDTICFGHEKTAADEVLRTIGESGGVFVPVRQGYTRCSVMKVGEKAVITADEGIAKEAASRKIDTLVISPGGISLPGYDHGFIGGASGVIGRNIFFFGSIDRHPDAFQICEFINKRGYGSVSLWNDGLVDLGGLYYFENTKTPARDQERGSTKKAPASGDRDDFWNIDLVVPKKRMTGFSSNTDAVLIELPSIDPRGSKGQRREAADAAVSAGLELARRRREGAAVAASAASGNTGVPVPAARDGGQNQPLYEYVPKNPLITSVTVFPWHSRYTFYDRLANDAERYFASTPPDGAEPTPFFSYMPQYSQMDRRQLAWYLSWREMVRSGEYPRVDYPYIALLLAETINVPQLLSPEDGLALLAGVWNNYRADYEKIDGLMTETVTDWCLINRLEAPFSLLSDEAAAAAVKISRFPEFWQASEDRSLDGAAVDYLMRRCSKYDYRRSKFYAGGDEKTRSSYDRHIRAAVAAVYASGAFGQIRSREVPYSRSSYTNLSCAWKNHRRISVRYIRFDISSGTGDAVSDVIRYAENKLRFLLGIKARLVVRIPETLSGPVDSYFAPLEPEAPRGVLKKDAGEAEYDSRYEPISTGLSAERAAEIERRSWSVTDALTAAFGETDTDESEPVPDTSADEEPDNKEKTGSVGIVPPAPDADGGQIIRKAVGQLLDGSVEGFRAAAREANMLPEAMLDLINETLYGILGDAAAEYDGESFSIVEDYREDIEKWYVGA
ncbi:MAG: TerB N-terminal domain-containing protein [Clostridiales bacterium]|nr:TerB N-terminal domain-containing protein [Clostridiales bacterium]